MSQIPDYTINPHGSPVLIGVIGGSGIYQLNILQNPKYYAIETPFGSPSGELCVAEVNGIACAFLPRHGPQHLLNPSEINYRANIYAMKRLGVRYIISINAVGSLHESYQPGDLVLVEQIIDKTTGRKSTFFENGIVAHADFAHPTSDIFREIAAKAIYQTFPELLTHNTNNNTNNNTCDWKLHHHSNITLVTMEGPQFSTRAESLLNQHMGGHLIGMTSATEAKLAREAEIAYLIIGIISDMDAWSTARPHVTGKSARDVLKSCAARTQMCLPNIIKEIANIKFNDNAHGALETAICTGAEAISSEVRQRLAPLLAKYPQYAVDKK